MKNKASFVKIKNCSKIFRIAGIYGKGRNIYERIKKGDYKLILKDKQYRIHIDDLTYCLKAL